MSGGPTESGPCDGLGWFLPREHTARQAEAEMHRTAPESLFPS